MGIAEALMQELTAKVGVLIWQKSLYRNRATSVKNHIISTYYNDIKAKTFDIYRVFIETKWKTVSE